MNLWFNNVVKPVLRLWLEKQFNLEANIPEEVKNLAPPILYFPLTRDSGILSWQEFI